MNPKKLKNLALGALVVYTANWGVMGLSTNDYNPNYFHQLSTLVKLDREYKEHRKGLTKLRELADTNKDGRLDGNELETMMKELGIDCNFEPAPENKNRQAEMYYSLHYRIRAPSLDKLQSAINSYEKGKHVRRQYRRWR